MATTKELLDATIELCNKVECQFAELTKLLQRSEERTNKLDMIFEMFCRVMSDISEENRNQRSNFTRYVDSLTADRNQIRDEYKKLVKECLDADASRDRDVKRLEALIEKLVEKIGSGVSINNN